MNDLRFAVRQLVKNPGFTVVAVLTLALGIGANTAIFSAVNTVLLRPLPFKQADRLVTIWESNPKQGYDRNMAATGTFLDWREQNHSFEGMGIFESNIGFALTGQGEAERIIGAKASAHLFQVLGTQPLLGRTFTPEEENSGSGLVAIVSHGLWQRRFGSEPRLVGKSITLDGKAYTVVGIMPAKFKFPGMTGVLFGSFANQPADLWVPLPLGGEARQVRGHHSWQVVARLKPGVSLAQAAAEMDTIQQRLAEQNPGAFMGTKTTIVPLRTQGVANVRLGLLILLGAAALLLLIACANVANLLLARALSRQKEMAVRLALGATRTQVIRQLLTESLVLASGGAILGILVAQLGIGLLIRLVPGSVAGSTPGWQDIGLDLPVLGFTVLTTLATAILFGLAPAWQAARTDVQGSLKEGSRGSSAGKQRQRLGHALVSAQFALALMLLIAAGLLIQSLSRLERVDPGFQPAHVLMMQLDLPDTKYPHDSDKAAFFERLLERVKTLPGAGSVGMTVVVPFGGGGWNFGIEIEGRSKDASGKIFTADWRPVTPDYFRTLGIRLTKGRGITEQDSEQAQKVVVVNEAFTRAFLPGEEPLGKRVAGFGGRDFVIVGVAHDFKQQTLDTEVRPEMYTPQAQTAWFGFRTVVVRTRGDPIALAGAVRSVVRELDPDLPITKLQTMETLLSDSVAQPRFRTLLLTLFSGLALILAAVGIYGMIAYSVSQRAQEIGIRMALGAQRRDVLALVMRHGLRLTLIGVGLGLVGAFAATRLLRSLLFEVKPSDPVAFLLVSALLCGVALLACYAPARRAMKIDPTEALRNE